MLFLWLLLAVQPFFPFLRLWFSILVCLYSFLMRHHTVCVLIVQNCVLVLLMFLVCFIAWTCVHFFWCVLKWMAVYIFFDVFWNEWLGIKNQISIYLSIYLSNVWEFRVFVNVFPKSWRRAWELLMAREMHCSFYFNMVSFCLIFPAFCGTSPPSSSHQWLLLSISSVSLIQLWMYCFRCECFPVFYEVEAVAGIMDLHESKNTITFYYSAFKMCVCVCVTVCVWVNSELICYSKLVP